MAFANLVSTCSFLLAIYIADEYTKTSKEMPRKKRAKLFQIESFPTANYNHFMLLDHCIILVVKTDFARPNINSSLHVKLND